MGESVVHVDPCGRSSHFKPVVFNEDEYVLYAASYISLIIERDREHTYVTKTVTHTRCETLIEDLETNGYLRKRTLRRVP